MERDTQRVDTGPEAAEVVSELATLAAGGGILAVALFPFAIPLLILTALAALPLIPLVLFTLVLAPPFMALRALVRRVRAAREPAAVDASPPATPHRGTQRALGVSH